MNYIKLKGEIVLLDNILHAEIKENTIEILYGINVPEQGNKFYGHVLDYSEVKNDVNEEKTKIEQDYEKLMKALIPEENNEYQRLIKCLKEERDYHLDRIVKIRGGLYDWRIPSFIKIKRIKEVLK